MKCAKCGAQLKVGCIYCSVCGQEAQIVSDYNLLEEELLKELLKEEETPKEPEKKTAPPIKKKKNHKPLIITLSCLGAVLIIAIAAIFIVINRNKNSYDYQVEKAEDFFAQRDYTKAVNSYKNAIELKADDVEARLSMVEVYLAMEEEKAAISMLHEVINLDSANKAAYQQLIQLYQNADDYESILKLQEQATDDEVLALFSEFQVMPPEFSLEPGNYAEHITIELTTFEDGEIFYTTNGSDPIEQGKLYEEPFQLEEQTTLKLKAVTCNEYGIYSEVVEGEFVVEYKKPQMPTANPDSGSYTEAISVELTGPEGSHIYYTWDGTAPTVASTEYTEPLPIPEGNNILSVILVDKYGMISDVLKCNYRYFPE